MLKNISSPVPFSASTDDTLDVKLFSFSFSLRIYVYEYMRKKKILRVGWVVPQRYIAKYKKNGNMKIKANN